MRVETEAIPEHGIEAGSIERVFRESGPGLWRAVYAYAGGRADIAEEAVAEAFARALQHSGSIRAPLPWLYRTAFRFAAREMRRERRVVPIEDRPVEPPGEPSELIAALGRLSPNQRASVVLHYHMDLPVREAARRLGMSPATVKVHLHRGRRRLRALLGGEEEMSDG